MKLSLALAVSFALAAPVLAQPPSGRTDWTKPVIGVDPAMPPPGTAEEIPITIVVEPVSASATEFARALNAAPRDTSPPKPPPCEPPVTRAKAGAVPPPCAPPPG